MLTIINKYIMKKFLLFVLCFSIACVNLFAEGSKPKCGLVMGCVGYEGTEMIGCYEFVHLMVQNPTDTVAYIPANGGLKAFRVYEDKEGKTVYDVMGTYDEELSLQPGEKKEIRIKAYLRDDVDCNYYLGAVGISKADETKVYELDEYFTDLWFSPEQNRKWNLSAEICVDGMAERNECNIAYGNKMKVNVKCQNNEEGAFTPSNMCLNLRGTDIERPLGDLYLQPGEECIKTFTIEDLELGDFCTLELRDMTNGEKYASVKVFLIAEPDKHGIEVEYKGVEGNVMYGCEPSIVINIRNTNDRDVSLRKDLFWEGFDIFRIHTEDDGNKTYKSVGTIYIDNFILKAGESIQKEIGALMVPKGHNEYCIGVFTNNNGDPDYLFSPFELDVTENRQWDLTADVEPSDIQTIDGRNYSPTKEANVSVTFINNEDELYTPKIPLIKVYQLGADMDYNNKNEVYCTGIPCMKFEPHVPLTKIRKLNYVLKEGNTYFYEVISGEYTSNWLIGRSEPFTVDTTLGVGGIEADGDRMVEVLTADGKHIGTGDISTVTKNLPKGMYIVKSGNKTRKIDI